MNLFLVLLLLLFTSRLMGELASRAKQPPLVGELIAGILIGFVALQVPASPLRGLVQDHSFQVLSDLGIFFLMLLGGTELRVREFGNVSGRSFVIALCGMLLPLFAGIWLGWGIFPESEMKMAQCLFLGTALSITAVPASIRVLMDLGRLHTRVGRTIVSAAIIDDLLSLILLAVLTGVLSNEGRLDFFLGFMIFGKTCVFLGITFLIEKYLVPRIRSIVTQFKSEEFGFSSLLIAGFAYAVFAELLDLHQIVGAFTAGLLFEQKYAGHDIYKDVKGKLNSVTVGFMAPVFFASIGLNLNLEAFAVIPGVACLLILVALLTKVLGAGVAARITGYTNQDAAIIGVGMSSRGMVEIIIANIALQAGLFTVPQDAPVVTYMFSAVVAMAIATTVLTPIALKWMVQRQQQVEPPDSEGPLN